MANLRSWGGTSRSRLTVMFLVVLLPPAVTLICLGLQLLAQDRALASQREIEGREIAAGAIARSLGQFLGEAESSARFSALPEGALGIIISSSAVQERPAGRVLWKSRGPSLPEAPTRPFDGAEKLEYQGSPESALVIYRELARSDDASVRAAALLRVARVEREHRIDEALKAYRALDSAQNLAVDGTPLDFLARRAVCELLEKSSRKQELIEEANALRRDFLAGRWSLDRATWDVASEEIERWTAEPLRISAERKALSAASDWIWEMSEDGNLRTSGRQILRLEGVPLTLVWHSWASKIEAVAIAPSLLKAWMERAAQSASGPTARLSLITESGELVAGDTPDSKTRVVLRTPVETGLPWTLALSASEATRETANFAGRRRLLSLGLAAIVMLLAGGSYVLWHVDGCGSWRWPACRQTSLQLFRTSSALL